MDATTQPQRIVILGGGFGGLHAALRLEKTLARDPNIEVTLVNHDNFFLFTPMLHEVATGDLHPAHIVNPIRKLLKRVNFFCGDVLSMDLERKVVVVAHGAVHHHHELPYDHLVLALGAVTNYFNLPGLAESALTMKTLGDALRLRNHAIRNLEEADFECCAEQRQSLLTFVVAGAGFSGVETIGGLNDFVRDSLRFYPHLTQDMVRLVLVESGPCVLKEMSEKLGRYTEKKLAQRGVEIRLNTRVLGLSERGVALSGGETLPTNTLIWTSGTAPSPQLAALPCRKERGRVVVNEFLEVPEWPGVWALGDCAVVPNPKTGKPYPPTAQHALREGKIVARNIEAVVRGGEKRPFTFSMLGQLATIGRRAGVATLFGLHFSGLLAWFFWRLIYLMKLPRFEKKLRVALDWTLDLFFSKDLVQLGTDFAPVVAQEEDACARNGRMASEHATVSLCAVGDTPWRDGSPLEASASRLGS